MQSTENPTPAHRPAVIPSHLFDLTAAVARAKVEIRADIANGRVPASVRSFGELHDHVDADEYGGLSQLPESEALVDFAAAVRDVVDVWLEEGRP